MIIKRDHFVINLEIMYFTSSSAQFCFHGASDLMKGSAFLFLFFCRAEYVARAYKINTRCKIL